MPPKKNSRGRLPKASTVRAEQAAYARIGEPRRTSGAAENQRLEEAQSAFDEAKEYLDDVRSKNYTGTVLQSYEAKFEKARLDLEAANQEVVIADGEDVVNAMTDAENVTVDDLLKDVQPNPVPASEQQHRQVQNELTAVELKGIAKRKKVDLELKNATDEYKRLLNDYWDDRGDETKWNYAANAYVALKQLEDQAVGLDEAKTIVYNTIDHSMSTKKARREAKEREQKHAVNDEEGDATMTEEVVETIVEEQEEEQANDEKVTAAADDLETGDADPTFAILPDTADGDPVGDSDLGGGVDLNASIGRLTDAEFLADAALKIAKDIRGGGGGGGDFVHASTLFGTVLPRSTVGNSVEAHMPIRLSSKPVNQPARQGDIVRTAKMDINVSVERTPAEAKRGPAYPNVNLVKPSITMGDLVFKVYGRGYGVQDGVFSVFNGRPLRQDVKCVGVADKTEAVDPKSGSTPVQTTCQLAVSGTRNVPVSGFVHFGLPGAYKLPTESISSDGSIARPSYIDPNDPFRFVATATSLMFDQTGSSFSRNAQALYLGTFRPTPENGGIYYDLELLNYIETALLAIARMASPASINKPGLMQSLILDRTPKFKVLQFPGLQNELAGLISESKRATAKIREFFTGETAQLMYTLRGCLRWVMIQEGRLQNQRIYQGQNRIGVFMKSGCQGKVPMKIQLV